MHCSGAVRVEVIGSHCQLLEEHKLCRRQCRWLGMRVSKPQNDSMETATASAPGETSVLSGSIIWMVAVSLRLYANRKHVSSCRSTCTLA